MMAQIEELESQKHGLQKTNENLVTENRTLLDQLEAINLPEGVAAHLLEPPVNVLRLALHPEGMAPRIENLGEWRAHLLQDLAAQRDQTGDPDLHALYAELEALPGPTEEPGGHEVFVPLKIDGLTFLSTRTTFGTALDVTVSELAIEAFYPADAITKARLEA